MIRHLHPEGFCLYGNILPANSSISRTPNHHSVLLAKDTVSEYRTVGPLWLAAETGLAVLAVSADGEAFAEFYLDRPVQLHSGIWFRLAGLQGRCCVQMGGSSMPRFMSTRANDRIFAVHPQVRVERLYTLFYQEKERGFVFPGESHPMAELIWVDGGSLHSVADGEDVLLKQGELMLYAPDQWHMQYADMDQAPRIVTVSFDAVGLPWEQLVNRRFAADSFMLQLLRQTLREQERTDTYSVDRIFALLTLLLLQLCDGFAVQSKRMPGISAENIVIQRAQQYITDHVEEKLTVPMVAQNTGVSPSYLTALFQKHLQIAPGEYIRRVKLQQSKQLIREGQMNFTQIAQNLQYATVHHFSRQFKKMFGMTPTEYAKSVR